MRLTVDDRAREASEAIRAAADLRDAGEPPAASRVPIRVLVTAVVLVIALCIGAFFALRSASPRDGGAASQPSGRYEAQAYLISGEHSNGPNLGQTALLLRIGVVPARVAQQLQSALSPPRIVDQVRVATDAKVGRITITSDQPTAARAITVVNAFAEQLVRYVSHVAEAAYNTAVARALERTHQISHSLIDVETQLRTHPNDANLTAQNQALQTAFASANKSYAQAVSAGVPSPTWRVVAADTATLLPSTSHSTNHRPLAVVLIALAVLLLVGAAGFGIGRRRTVRPT